MKICLGSDHGGYELKEEIKKLLEKRNIPYEDMGTNSGESVDYPDYGKKVCEYILSGKADKGILVCGSGIGISISANRFKGIRAALCSEPLSAELSRKHNDANVLCLGGRLIGTNMAEKILDVWLSTEFEGDRHVRRINKLDEI